MRCQQRPTTPHQSPTAAIDCFQHALRQTHYTRDATLRRRADVQELKIMLCHQVLHAIERKEDCVPRRTKDLM